MNLSNDTLRKFADLLNVGKPASTSTTYGTVKLENGNCNVYVDGVDTPLKISNDDGYNTGDRVTVKVTDKNLVDVSPAPISYGGGKMMFIGGGRTTVINNGSGNVDSSNINGAIRDFINDNPDIFNTDTANYLANPTTGVKFYMARVGETNEYELRVAGQSGSAKISKADTANTANTSTRANVLNTYDGENYNTQSTIRATIDDGVIYLKNVAQSTMTVAVDYADEAGIAAEATKLVSADGGTKWYIARVGETGNVYELKVAGQSGSIRVYNSQTSDHATDADDAHLLDVYVNNDYSKQSRVRAELDDGKVWLKHIAQSVKDIAVDYAEEAAVSIESGKLVSSDGGTKWYIARVGETGNMYELKVAGQSGSIRVYNSQTSDRATVSTNAELMDVFVNGDYSPQNRIRAELADGLIKLKNIAQSVSNIAVDYADEAGSAAEATKLVSADGGTKWYVSKVGETGNVYELKVAGQSGTIRVYNSQTSDHATDADDAHLLDVYVNNDYTKQSRIRAEQEDTHIRLKHIAQSVADVYVDHADYADTCGSFTTDGMTLYPEYSTANGGRVKLMAKYNGTAKSTYCDFANTAGTATSAGTASNADHATNANYATTAGTANSADTATTAGNANYLLSGDGNTKWYVSKVGTTGNMYELKVAGQSGSIRVYNSETSDHATDADDAHLLDVYVNNDYSKQNRIRAEQDGNKVWLKNIAQPANTVSVGYASEAGSVAWSNITGKPNNSWTDITPSWTSGHWATWDDFKTDISYCHAASADSADSADQAAEIYVDGMTVYPEYSTANGGRVKLMAKYNGTAKSTYCDFANTAGTATSAGTASNADHATNANHATTADTANSADTATTAGNANYLLSGDGGTKWYVSKVGTTGNMYELKVAGQSGSIRVYNSQTSDEATHSSKTNVMQVYNGSTYNPQSSIRAEQDGSKVWLKNVAQTASTVSVGYASEAGSANSVAWSNVTGKPTIPSALSWTELTPSWTTGHWATWANFRDDIALCHAASADSADSAGQAEEIYKDNMLVYPEYSTANGGRVKLMAKYNGTAKSTYCDFANTAGTATSAGTASNADYATTAGSVDWNSVMNASRNQTGASTNYGWSFKESSSSSWDCGMTHGYTNGTIIAWNASANGSFKYIAGKNLGDTPFSTADTEAQETDCAFVATNSYLKHKGNLVAENIVTIPSNAVTVSGNGGSGNTGWLAINGAEYGHTYLCIVTADNTYVEPRACLWCCNNGNSMCCPIGGDWNKLYTDQVYFSQVSASNKQLYIFIKNNRTTSATVIPKVVLIPLT